VIRRSAGKSFGDIFARVSAPRADAQENRRRLLAAAAGALAEEGFSVTMQAIARRAGLTKMTLYRHFACKNDLVLAVMADHYDRLRAVADELAETVPDPFEALASYVRAGTRQVSTDRAYFHVALMAGGVNETIKTSARALDTAIGRLLLRAQTQNAVRDDVVAGDVHALMLGASSLDDAAWDCCLEVLLDGLRPSARELAEPPMRFEDYARFQQLQAERRSNPDTTTATNRRHSSGRA
jgi:AcrR family transcriptional regulator